MRKAACLVIIVVGLGGPTLAQAQVDCGAFLKVLEHSNKLIALENAQGIGDNSAVRAQLEEARIANYLRRMELNLTLMIQHKCAVPKEPFTPGDYLENALKCSTEQIKGNFKSPECDLDKWVKRSESSKSAPTQ